MDFSTHSIKQAFNGKGRSFGVWKSALKIQKTSAMSALLAAAIRISSFCVMNGVRRANTYLLLSGNLVPQIVVFVAF